MKARKQDALTLVRKFGKPDFFITLRVILTGLSSHATYLPGSLLRIGQSYVLGYFS